MFVYDKQKSQNVESAMLKQVEIDITWYEEKNKIKITSRKSEEKSEIVIEIISSKYKRVKTQIFWIKSSMNPNKNEVTKKIKKIFSIAAPTMNLRKKGEGVRVKNIGG